VGMCLQTQTLLCISCRACGESEIETEIARLSFSLFWTSMLRTESEGTRDLMDLQRDSV
jgi:hypothetical protein